MSDIYQIDTALDVPIYRQLADSLQAAIRKGILSDGDQLPTVQELSTQLAIARGTIKRTYDELERAGMIQKVQGRGTFVCWRPVDPASRKDQAMAAIDTMLNSLDEMGFSPAEINIFLNLKLRERAEKESYLKVALVECNPETISAVTDQLRSLRQVELYSFLVENLESYPYKLTEEFDLVVTTAAHGEFVEQILPPDRRVAQVALRADRESLSQIIRLAPETRVGVLAYSRRYGELLQKTCHSYGDTLRLGAVWQLEQEDGLEGYLAQQDVLLLPPSWEKYCSGKVHRAVQDLPKILCSYEMDEGSLLYLQRKLRRLLESKQI